MRFGIDIDGVVADFIAAFVREANDIWPGVLPIGYQPSAWNWPDLTDAQRDQVWNRIYAKPNWWLSVGAYGENVSAIAHHRAKRPDDEIFYVTARVPTIGMPVMHQTQLWLTQCGIGGLGTAVIVDNSGDKCGIFNSLECDANVDDKLEAVIEHTRRTKRAYLLARPWNIQGRPSSVNSVRNLEEFFRRVNERV